MESVQVASARFTLRKQGTQEDNKKKRLPFLSESTREVGGGPSQKPNQPAHSEADSKPEPVSGCIGGEVQVGEVPDDKLLFTSHLEFH